MSNVPSRWNSVERWSPTLFSVGGGLMFGHATLSGIRAFTDLSTPPDAFVTTGHFVALLGLLGLYPVIKHALIRLARVAVAVSVIALVSWFVMTLTQLLALVGLVSSTETALPGVFFLLVLSSTILTYGFYGVAALSVDSESRKVGLLVLVPGGLVTALVVVPVITGGTAFDGLVIGGGLALSMVALGYTLRSWDVRTERTTVGDDLMAG